MPAGWGDRSGYPSSSTWEPLSESCDPPCVRGVRLDPPLAEVKEDVATLTRVLRGQGACPAVLMLVEGLGLMEGRVFLANWLLLVRTSSLSPLRFEEKPSTSVASLVDT